MPQASYGSPTNDLHKCVQGGNRQQSLCEMQSHPLSPLESRATYAARSYEFRLLQSKGYANEERRSLMAQAQHLPNDTSVARYRSQPDQSHT